MAPVKQYEAFNPADPVDLNDLAQFNEGRHYPVTPEDYHTIMLQDKIEKAAIDGNWPTVIGSLPFLKPDTNLSVTLGTVGAYLSGENGGHVNAIIDEIKNIANRFPDREKATVSFGRKYLLSYAKTANNDTLHRLRAAFPNDQIVQRSAYHHENYVPTEQEKREERIRGFWRGYEEKVEPHHFAVVKHLTSNVPESITDHRGRTGTSGGYEGLHEDFAEHARKTQALVMKDPKLAIYSIDGEPHVKVYRGVAGSYAQKIRTAASIKYHNDPFDYHDVDDVDLHLPVAPLSSWSTDPEVAEGFASRKIPNHEQGAGVVLSRDMPVKDILHSGSHHVDLLEPAPHPEERELIFRHTSPLVTIPSSSIHSAHAADSKPAGFHEVCLRRSGSAPQEPEDRETRLVKKQPEKTESSDEIDRLLKHPDPLVRRIALKLSTVTPRHLMAAARDSDPGVRAVALAHPKCNPHVMGSLSNSLLQFDSIAKAEADIGVWLAKAFHPLHTAGVADASVPLPNQVVDHTGLMNAHPESVNASKREFEAFKADPHFLKPYSDKEYQGASKKVVYPAPSGDMMLKPFHGTEHEVSPEALGGWAEMTNQGIYHAAGIGDLHQKVHTAEVPQANGAMLPVSVVHMAPNHHPVCTVLGNDAQPDGIKTQARQIALLDFLVDNPDRHGANLMVNDNKDRLLAIDHGLAFQYRPHFFEEHRDPGDRPHQGHFSKSFFEGYQGSASKEIAGYNPRGFADSFKWWSQVGPRVRQSFDGFLPHIRDAALREHIRHNFHARADWLDEKARNGVSKDDTIWMADRVAQRLRGRAPPMAPAAPPPPAAEVPTANGWGN